MRKLFYRGRFIFIPLAVAAFLSFISFLVMNLWNYTLPGIFHVGFINFWQAMGLFVLSKLLFGFGNGGHKGGAPWMRHRMAERFKNMTPEEKERFKEKWARRCGHGRWDENTNWDAYAMENAKTE